MGKLTGWDKCDLRNAASDGVGFMIEHYYDILNIASHLNNGDVGAAFRDIMDKGLNELNMMCEMDDHVCQIEEDYTAVPFTDTEVKAWEDAHKEGKE